MAALPSPLIVKNTFICFKDEPAMANLWRHSSCPACFDEDMWATASTEDEDEDHCNAVASGTADAADLAAAFHGKACWADFSDDEDVAPTRPSAVPSRPVFPRATRASRSRHLQARVQEFCSFCFDAVDAAQQTGLTCRMLFLARALTDAEHVSYWEDEERKKEETFRLLGLFPEDVGIIRSVIDSASQLIDSHMTHPAFHMLTSLRPWFQAATASELEEQRMRLRAEAEPEEKGGAGEAEVPEEAGKSEQRSAWMTVSRAVRSPAPPGRVIQPWADVAAKGPKGPKGAGKAVDKGPKGKGQVAQVAQVFQRPPEPQGKGKGSSRDRPRKLLGFFVVGIEEEPSFRVCRRLIGPGGEHMKRIVTQCGAAGTAVKLRLRGRGSKFLEGDKQAESDEPLMLCISAEYEDSYDLAASLTSALLSQVQEDYRSFCQARRMKCPDLVVKLQAGRGA